MGRAFHRCREAGPGARRHGLAVRPDGPVQAVVFRRSCPREHSPVDPIDPRLRVLRRSTATSWRKTSISTFFDADDLASSASQDSTRTVKRQSRRTGTVTHHPRLEPMAEFQEYYRHAGALAGHEAHRLGRRRRPQRSGSSVGSSSAASSGKSLGYTSSGAQSGAVPVMARSRATRMASVRVGMSNAP